MKKQKVLYGILLAGCMVQFFAVLVMVLLIPMPPLPASGIAVVSGSVTMAVFFLLSQRLEQEADSPAPPAAPQNSQNPDVSGMLCGLKQELREYMDGTMKVCTENDGLKSALREKETELKKYQQSARQMQGWIDSFPCKITPEFKLYNLFETEIVTGAYSRWLVPGEENGMLFSIEIIRPDNQNKIELFQMLKNVKTKEEILKFDLAKELFNPELQSA